MAEELLVVLNRSENAGFGFSLLGKPGLPPIIYNILDDSPAAESGEVEVGDVILKVNETDVNRFSTKEVLKCLRLSSDPVTLKIKRDPKIKATVRKHLLAVNSDADNRNRGGGGGLNNALGLLQQQHHYSQNRNQQRPEPAVHQSHLLHHHARTNGSCLEQEPLLLDQHLHHNLQQQQPQPLPSHHQHDSANTNNTINNEENGRLHWEPLAASNNDLLGSNNSNNKTGAAIRGQQPKFEAYMMTGEHILNISRMPQSASIIPKQQKKVDSLRYHNSHTHHLRHQQQQQQLLQHNSVPNSPNEMDLGLKGNGSGGGNNHHHCKSGPNSANTSPVSANKWDSHPTSPATAGDASKCYGLGGAGGGGSYVRTSRSEDQLQGQNDSSMGSMSAMVNADVLEDDITSSLNTLLDTRPDSANGGGGSNNALSSGASGDSDRIVWTYNAPVTDQQLLLQQQQQQQHHKFCHTLSNGSNSSSQHSNTSPSSSSPMHSGSPASPTSVSSSVMSSQSGSKRLPYVPAASTNGGSGQPHTANGGDYSMSEAISNISSPDYHDDDSMGIRDCVMEISDHSDSDSTLLVSEPKQRHHHHGQQQRGGDGDNHHRIVIQVKGPEKDAAGSKGRGCCCDSSSGRNNRNDSYGYQLSDEQDIDDEHAREAGKSSSPQSSEDESDVESLHSFHYSPKAVDLPSAIRLAKRLYSLDGFKKSDVSRHLSKNNDFSRAVAEEYLKYFDFENDTLDIALRKFLKQFSLTGETQERERVLVHFSKRYLDCNPGSFNSQDAVHTLTCAIMLLNTDLHGQNMNRKMTCNEFIENLAGLNECDNFPREVLKQLYHAIKNYPLEWAIDEDVEDGTVQKNNDQLSLGGNPFLDVPVSSNAVEYKKGYVMRKCCYEANAKRTPFHKRNWKMFYCTLRDLVLYLHKDENGFRKNQMGDNLHNAIRIHHALATKATDYVKKQYVFRLQTADQAEYLFQTSDSKELQSWIDTINFVCASFSAPPLEAAVGSQKKFQRPLLPCSHTKLNLREQLRDHEERVLRLEAELDDHRKSPPERGSKSLVVQNYKEKETYLNFEVKRYRTYAFMLRSRMSQYPEGIILIENSIGEVDEATGVTLMDGPSGGIVPPPIPDRPSPPTNRRGPE